MLSVRPLRRRCARAVARQAPRAEPTPRPSAPARVAACALAAAALLALGGPAAAELRVQVGRTNASLYVPVRIVVTDPLGGLDANPGPISVTMADSQDRRRAVTLEPSGRPGEWSGWFTPVSTGRYTGTAVLERGDEKEIGLVPLLRVGPSRLPGFVRLHAASRRAFQYSNGDTLFPIGVRLSPADLRGVSRWAAELTKLRSFGINYVEVPVEWPGSQPEGERRAALERIDALLQEVDRVGRPRIQLRLQGPGGAVPASGSAYEDQLRRWVRRWCYSPSIAAWYLDAAPEQAGTEQPARFVQAVRSADAYHHLIGVPGKSGEARGGADFTVAPLNWEQPADQFSILEAPEQDSGTPLPGESTWQMLAVGGIGLPLWPYHPAQPNTAFLQRAAMLVDVAASIPLHLRSTQVRGLVPVDSPGAFSRIGPEWIGWTGTEGGRPLVLPLGPGRYRARFWDPGNDLYLRDTFLTSSGSSVSLDLPPNLKAVFVQVEPLGFRYGLGHGMGAAHGGQTIVARAAPPPVLSPIASGHAARAAAHLSALAARQSAHNARLRHAQLALAHRQAAARRRAEAHERAYAAWKERKARHQGKASRAQGSPRAQRAHAARASRAARTHRWAKEVAWQNHLRRLVLREQAELHRKRGGAKGARAASRAVRRGRRGRYRR